jgi:FMN phosphatase YigB (HAD superfamily)
VSAVSIRIVCFDVGGVLVRIHRSWPDVCHAVGLQPRGNWSGEVHGRAHQTADQAAYQTMMDLFGTGQIDETEWSERLSIALSGAYTPAELLRIHRAWPRHEYPGIAELVDELHRNGFETACLSNTTADHWLRLVHQDDAGRPRPGAPEFPSVPRLRRHFASHILGLAKPDPAIFRAFEAATGHSGRAVLFFDDLGPNVTAARAIGWNAEQIDHERETAPQLRRHLTRHGII